MVQNMVLKSGIKLKVYMEFKIIKSLGLVASFCPSWARLLDVGSDHAYLPIASYKKASKIEAAIAGKW